MEGVTAAERVTGIPKTTIQYWTETPEFAQLRTTARETVTAQFWAGIQIGARAVIAGLEGDAPLKDKAIAVGMLVEKYALLAGEATARTEHRDATEPATDDALAAAHTAYLRVLEGPVAVVGTNGSGASSNGHSTVSAISLSGAIARRPKPSQAHPEGSPNGHFPDGRDRGTVAG